MVHSALGQWGLHSPIIWNWLLLLDLRLSHSIPGLLLLIRHLSLRYLLLGASSGWHIVGRVAWLPMMTSWITRIRVADDLLLMVVMVVTIAGRTRAVKPRCGITICRCHVTALVHNIAIIGIHHHGWIVARRNISVEVSVVTSSGQSLIHLTSRLADVVGLLSITLLAAVANRHTRSLLRHTAHSIVPNNSLGRLLVLLLDWAVVIVHGLLLESRLLLSLVADRWAKMLRSR